MNKTIEYWENIIKDFFKDWTIGTNVHSYIDRSVINWFDQIDFDQIDYDLIIEWETNEDNNTKLFFKEKEDIEFYSEGEKKNNKDGWYSESTYRQLLDILKAFSIVIYKNNKNVVNKKFIDFLKKHPLKDFNEDKKKIIKEFIIDNFSNHIKKYILFPISSENRDDRNRSVYNFWWTLIMTINDKFMDLKINDIFTTIQSPEEKTMEFYTKFINEYLCDEKALNHKVYDSMKNFINKQIKEITNIDLLWESEIAIGVNGFNKEHLEKNEKNVMDQEIDKSDNNSDEDFPLINSSLYDFLTSKHAVYELPLYQRTYSWDANIIIGLFDTLFNDFKDEEVKFSLLNNIIISSSVNRKIYILDGQQRITSLIIILCALIKYYYKLDPNQQEEKSNNKLNELIAKPIKQIIKLLNEFAKNDKNYNYLLKIITTENYLKDKLGNEIKASRFYKNWREIVSLVPEKIQKDKDLLIDFISYVLNKTRLVVSYLLKLDRKRCTKIFCNLNRYSKKLGALDLFRTKISELDQLVDIYNNSINLYFRNSYNSTKDEDLDLIQNFLNSALVKYKLFNAIVNIDRDYSDRIINSLEKFEILLKEYEKNNDDPDYLNLLWNDILEFNYCSYGSSDELIQILDKNKIDALAKLKNNTYEFIAKNKKTKYINFQIYHLSHGGRKSIFAMLVWTLAEHFRIFSLEKPDNNHESFSKYLVQIEKFVVLWRIKFRGQSLPKIITKICEEIVNKDNKLIQPSVLYQKLEDIITELKEPSKETKISELYVYLLNELNSEKTKENKTQNKNINEICKIILGRLAYGVGQTGFDTPQYFKGYNSDDETVGIFDFIPYTYDHNLAQKLKDQDLEYFYKQNIQDFEIQNVIHKIGNGSLITRKDNSSKGNRTDTSKGDPDKSNITNKGKDTKYKMFNFEPFDESVKIGQIGRLNKLEFHKTKTISLPYVIQTPTPDENKKENQHIWDIKNINREQFDKNKKYIEERSKTIIQSYISMLFYDWIDEDEK
ncbi:hypothetical protein JM47_01625 [Ureaplasma diversum]|uniref:GmrSD restriction endonucleases N-terminal domain-containing protein n=1 Tax=Ureaplasma diversum TaxID=42094 RepID=A0A0C5RKX7_9BACT|nr:DUF262 domain-containing protein [Ureaplasma diversum]AJQ45303.1 hypothetical protein JM47_01625 [Ureaplasma diversum]